MNKIPYPKQFISFTDQIALLKQRGLNFIKHYLLFRPSFTL